MPSMKVVYIRTSKKDQNPELQRQNLEVFERKTFFEERMASRKADDPELRAAPECFRESGAPKTG